MKLYSLFALFILVSTQLYSKEKISQVVLSGFVKNFESKEIVIEDISETSGLQITTLDRRFIPASNGQFTVRFDLQYAGYFMIGRNILYLSPGDRIVMNIDYTRPENATFAGDHSKENDFLRFRTYVAGGSYLQSGDSVKASIIETISTLLSIVEEKAKVLQNYKGISTAFKDLELARIKADMINSLHYLKFYFPYVNHLKGDSLKMFEDEYSRVVVPLMKEYSRNFVNPGYLNLEVYRKLVSFILEESDENDATATIRDWQRAGKLVHSMKSISSFRGFRDSFDIKVNAIRSAKYREVVKVTYQRLLKHNGKEAVNFVMKDSSGNRVDIKSFSGKFIYIDLWATWCGPCLQDMPYLDSLRERYKDTEDLAIITLSIDDDTTAWKKELNTKRMGGYQYIVGREQLAPYLLSEIPRTILIGKKFEILAMRAPKPSDKDINRFLNNMLKD